MAKIETVKVNRGGVKVIVNKCDFDPSKESLWVDKKAPPKVESDNMDLDAFLAKEYESLYGKKPHHKMKRESVKEAIEKAKSEAE